MTNEISPAEIVEQAVQKIGGDIDEALALLRVAVAAAIEARGSDQGGGGVTDTSDSSEGGGDEVGNG